MSHVDCRLHLPFNGADEAISCEDLTGRHNAITFNGTAQLDTAVKKFGTACLKLDGNSDSLSLPDSPDWDVVADVTKNWTVIVWVKHTDHAGDEIYLQHFEDANNLWQLVHSHGNGLYFRVVQDGITTIDSGYGGEIENTQWHCVVVVKVANEIGIYLDGQQVCYVQDSDVAVFAGLLYIGATGTPSHYFDGHIDSVSIFKSNVFEAAPNSGKTDIIDTLNPAAHWKLDDNLATTAVLDSSGNDYDGTLAGGDNTEDKNVPGQVDDAFDMNELSGAGDYVDADDPFQSLLRGSFSISVWVKPDDGHPGVNKTVVGMLDSTGDDSRILMEVMTTGKMQFVYESEGDEGNHALTDEVIFSDGAAADFTHIVMVADSSIGGVGGKKIYINGSEVTLDGTKDGSTSGVTFSNFTSAQNLYFGGFNYNGNDTAHIDGKLDDVQLYGKVLTAAEVLNLYNSGMDGESGVAKEYESYEILPTFPTYPVISRGVEITPFNDPYSDDSMRRSANEDGYPLTERRYTIDPMDISFALKWLTDDDKDVLKDFYKEHGHEVIALLHPTEDVYYEVKFSRAPTCQVDTEKDYWQMDFVFRQVSTTTWS